MVNHTFSDAVAMPASVNQNKKQKSKSPQPNQA
jgi:hypothetical protein